MEASEIETVQDARIVSLSSKIKILEEKVANLASRVQELETEMRTKARIPWRADI